MEGAQQGPGLRRAAHLIEHEGGQAPLRVVRDEGSPGQERLPAEALGPGTDKAPQVVAGREEIRMESLGVGRGDRAGQGVLADQVVLGRQLAAEADQRAYLAASLLPTSAKGARGMPASGGRAQTSPPARAWPARSSGGAPDACPTPYGGMP